MSSLSHVQVALARKTLTATGMGIFAVAAAAPLVVLFGGLPATYAGTELQSLPLMFLIVGGVVGLLAVGYTAMIRQVPHAAAFYAILARGLSNSLGVAGGFVALLSYNAIQISLYGLLGYTVAGLIGGVWWAWALLALAGVAALGVRAIALSTRVLATILFLSAVLMTMFVVASVSSPDAGRLTYDGFSLTGIFATGGGGAIALCVAAFMGFEVPGPLSEEARSNDAVRRAVFRAIGFLMVAYALLAWSMAIAVGIGNVAGIAADPTSGFPFSIMESRIGGFMTPITQLVLIAAIVTSMAAFHNIIARYVFAMAREGVLARSLARTGSGTRVSAPVGGSMLQTGIAATVVILFAAIGMDPLADLFTVLSTLGAFGLLSLLIAASVAAMTYFSRHRPSGVGVLTTTVAPLLGVIFGGFVLAMMVINMGSLLGVSGGGLLPYVLPLAVVAAAVVGLSWAGHLRRGRPDVYRGISRGRPDVHAVPDDIKIDF
jgi:amino acid transporter